MTIAEERAILAKILAYALGGNAKPLRVRHSFKRPRSTREPVELYVQFELDGEFIGALFASSPTADAGCLEHGWFCANLGLAWSRTEAVQRLFEVFGPIMERNPTACDAQP